MYSTTRAAMYTTGRHSYRRSWRTATIAVVGAKYSSADLQVLRALQELVGAGAAFFIFFSPRPRDPVSPTPSSVTERDLLPNLSTLACEESLPSNSLDHQLQL